MSLAELVIVSVMVEGRSKSEVARDYKISRYWVQQLVRRYEAEGEAAFQPRSRRPHTNPRAISLDLEDQIVRLRKDLSKQGLDAGAETIRTHLQTAGARPRLPSVSTIWRVLTRRGFVTPQPRKRPKGAGNRFAAEQPNERWQADTTHWQLADGTGVEILNIIDDHSRLDLLSKATADHHRPRRRWPASGPRSSATASRPACSPTTAPSSPANPAAAAGSPWRSSSTCSASGSTTPGPTTPRPAARSSDSTRPRRSGWPPSHPPATLADLQRQLDRFRRYYNTVRPHRAVGRRPPSRPTWPAPRPPPTRPLDPAHYRVRRDKTDTSGAVTLRYNSRLRHIGLGREHARTRVTAPGRRPATSAIVDADTGELLRELTLDPTRTTNPSARPPGPPKGDR